MTLAATGQIGAWGGLGAIVLATGIFRFCGLYAVLGLNTCTGQRNGDGLTSASVAEWSIAPVLKTGNPKGLVSSNRIASA